MLEHLPYWLLADLVLMFHVCIVLFVIGGLVLVIIGNFVAGHWVHNLWFRLLHLGAIATVIVEAWLGYACPLTSLEMWLRAKAQETTYSSSFIEHWLQQVLYYEAPAWVFITGYSLFGLLVAASWWYFPPRLHGNARDSTNNTHP